LPRYIT